MEGDEIPIKFFEEEYQASLERLLELSSLFKDGREEEDGRNVSFF